MKKRKGQPIPRMFIYTVGLLIMALGIVLLIKADLGASPWDVLHVGLFYQLGLTIGSWSIIVGLAILGIAAIITKELPPMAAFLNMFLIGLFIDMYLLLPFMKVPFSLTGKMIMFSAGLVLMGYGMGIYISAQFGAGPRDGLMLAITSITGWKIQWVRSAMELIVLLAGWQLGGPVSWGTVLICLGIGPMVGFALPQCQRLTNWYLAHIKSRQMLSKNNRDETNRGAIG